MQGSMRTAGPPTEPQPYPQQPSYPEPSYPQQAYAEQSYTEQSYTEQGYTQQTYAEQDPPTLISPPAAQLPPTAPQEQVRDAFGRLVVVDLSGRAPGIHAPAQAPVRVLGSNTPTSLSTERWGDRVVDLGAAPLLRREPRPRARGRTALVAACVAATLAVGGVVVVAMMNQPGAFKVDIGDQLTVEPTVVPEAPTADQPGPSVAVPSLLGGPSVVVPAPVGGQPGNAAPAKPATAKTTATASPKASTAKPSVKPSASPSPKPSTADPTPSPEPTKPSPEPTKPSPEPTVPSPDPTTVTIPVPSPVKSLSTQTAAPAVGAGG